MKRAEEVMVTNPKLDETFVDGPGYTKRRDGVSFDVRKSVKASQFGTPVSTVWDLTGNKID